MRFLSFDGLRANLIFYSKYSASWQPQNVLFVDDSKDDIEDVIKKLKGKNISCQAILFTGAYEKHEDISKENFAESWNAILKKAEIFANEAGIKFWR